VRSTPRSRRALAGAAALAIVVVATALRVWRLDWGLARDAYFVDEAFWGERIRSFVPLRCAAFVPHDLIYPTLYGELGGLAAAGLRAAGALGPLPATFTPGLLLLARAVSAAAGVVGVGLAGALGAALWGPGAGLAAAAFLAVAPLDAMQTHYASVDVLLAGLLTAAVLAALALARRPTTGRAVVAGALAGLAGTAKYTGVVAAVPVACAIVAGTPRAPRRAAALAAAALAAFGAALIVGCPPCVLAPGRVAAALATHHERSTTLAWAFSNNHLEPSLGWYARPYLYELAASLPYALGWPLWLTALAGIGVALRRRTAGDTLLLATLAAYLVAVARYPVTFPRYLLPLLPGLAALAGRAVAALRPALARATVVALVCGYGAALAASQVARFSTDQQEGVARWIADHVAARAASGGEVRVAVPWFGDYFGLVLPLTRAGLRPVLVREGHWLDERPDALVIPDWYAISLARDRPASGAARDLAALRAGALGYCEAARWRSSFLTETLYTALDPAFAADLWQGEIGFAVYVRAAPPDGVAGAAGSPPLALWRR